MSNQPRQPQGRPDGGQFAKGGNTTSNDAMPPMMDDYDEIERMEAQDNAIDNAWSDLTEGGTDEEYTRLHNEASRVIASRLLNMRRGDADYYDVYADMPEYRDLATHCKKAMMRDPDIRETDASEGLIDSRVEDRLPDELEYDTAKDAESIMAYGRTDGAKRYIRAVRQWLEDNEKTISENEQPSAGFTRQSMVEDALADGQVDTTPLEENGAATLDDFNVSAVAGAIGRRMTRPDGQEWARRVLGEE